MGTSRISRRRKLLFQTKRSQGVAAAVPRESQRRGHSGFSPARTAQRGRETKRRSLHLASEIPARLGNRAALRQRFRELRLVRRAHKLHQLDRKSVVQGKSV